MTVLTKASILVRKPDVLEAPLVHDNICDEEKVDIQPPGSAWAAPKRSAGGLFCMSVTALVMAVTGITCGLMLYRHYLRTNASHRYQAFCSIPLDNKADTLIQWQLDPDVQVFTDDELAYEEALREKFDIGESFENIAVWDNDRKVQFIHDFTVNLTNIVDSFRCFSMHLDESTVMSPERLAAGIERGEKFDTTRVRSAVRVELPPAAPQAIFTDGNLVIDRCLDKPFYMLRVVEGVRKRSTEDPPHDFLQFSGKHIQEIEIQNKQEMLDYERDLQKKPRSARSIIAY